jgi:hypothetical protein
MGELRKTESAIAEAQDASSTETLFRSDCWEEVCSPSDGVTSVLSQLLV